MERFLRAFIICVSLSLLAATAALAEDTPVYQGASSTTLYIRQSPSMEAERAGAYYNKDEAVTILSYDLEWMYVVKNGVYGYVPRRLVDVTKKLNVDAPPYGVLAIRHVATVAREAPMYAAPSADSNTLVNLPDGARVAVVSIQDGWVKMLYNRQYGYVHASHIKELEPVARDAEKAGRGALLAAFQTVYNTTQSELNLGRMNNIAVAAEYMDGQMIEPGKAVSFNEWIGPYSFKRGFMTAPVLINGTSMPGTGGGTCQVSTTLYNALLELRGISILQRRAHGPSGAAYVPHGTDAAVGNDSLDLVFRNDFNFSLEMRTWVGDGILFISIYKS